MKKYCTWIVALFLATLANSDVAYSFGRASSNEFDPFNSYRWNLKNYEAGRGEIDRKDWYEWWYYKAIIPETREAVLFTYGVVNPWDLSGRKSASKSFVSFGHLDSGFFVENSFPVGSFSSRYDSIFTKIGSNIATDQKLLGSIQDSMGRKVSWDVAIEKDWTFNAMGWAMGVDWISNIFWYPAQASAFMTGWVDLGDRRILLNRAPAYQDRNWGRSFPKWWAWLVSNRFEGYPGTVLAAGGGRPAFLGEFDLTDAFTIGLRHKGQEYAFRVTTGDPIKMDIRFGKWEVEASNHSGERILISAYAPREKFLILPFVTPQGGMFYDYEALLGDIHVELFKNDERIADLYTHDGGIEFGSPDQFEIDRLFGSHVHLR